MPSAQIRIDQASNPQPAGIAGRARDDLLLGLVVTLRNADDTDVNRHLWSMLDRPLGSAATLSSTVGPVVTFVPDIPGSYRVRLAVNDGIAGQTQVKIAGVRDGFDRLYPAVGQLPLEANYLVGGSPNTNGWGKEVEGILRSLGVPQLLSAVASGGVAKAASVSVVVGAIGLPSTSAEVSGYDFVDVIGNFGAAPTVNGETFSEVVGANALAAICTADVDLDTSGTTIGDKWALVMIAGSTPLLLAVIEIV